jgi:hypothetical protein
MKNSEISVSRMVRQVGPISRRIVAPRIVSSKSTQKLYNRKPLQQNQQLGARVLHSFHAETVQIHTESAQQ